MPIRKLRLIFRHTAGIFNERFLNHLICFKLNKHQHRPSAAKVGFYFPPVCSRMLFMFQDEHRANDHCESYMSHFIVSRGERWSLNQSERGGFGSDSQLEKMGFLSFF